MQLTIPVMLRQLAVEGFLPPRAMAQSGLDIALAADLSREDWDPPSEMFRRLMRTYVQFAANTPGHAGLLDPLFPHLAACHRMLPYDLMHDLIERGMTMADLSQALSMNFDQVYQTLGSPKVDVSTSTYRKLVALHSEAHDDLSCDDWRAILLALQAARVTEAAAGGEPTVLQPIGAGSAFEPALEKVRARLAAAEGRRAAHA